MIGLNPSITHCDIHLLPSKVTPVVCDTGGFQLRLGRMCAVLPA